MADHGRAPQHPLEPSQPVEPAPEAPSRSASSFYQVLRRIESEHRALPRLGRAADPASEPVRLGQAPTVAFEAASITAREARSDGVERLSVGFFGMFGANGPLPLHLSEFAYQRVHSHRDPTFARFADIFHHRLLTLYYRAWADAQPTVSHDRPDDDRIARYLSALAGQPLDDGERPDARVVRRVARHFTGRTRHAEGLCKALAELFGVAARIEEFLAEWLAIPDEYCWRLSSGEPSAQPVIGTLGTSTRIGTEVLERQFKFRIVLGPMSRASYERFLPEGDRMPQLVALIRRYVGSELAWDVRLELQQADLEPSVLGYSGRLGQTSYLGDPSPLEACSQDPLVLDPTAATR